jgi:hypothetical protein
MDPRNLATSRLLWTDLIVLIPICFQSISRAE